ncbi:carbohydrate ABC transporter permease [Kribbella sp. NPDC050241]|uniref:carbohydrate ABC transporter permease n=1 Tax=Kribbella sp. NPDC050241 TaxID=3364115 RepID=UPI00379CBEAB
MAAAAERDSGPDRLFTVANYLVLGVFLLMVLYPLTYIVSASLSDPQAVAAGKVWLWPVNFDLDGYKVIFEYKSIARGFANSIFYAVAGAVFSVVVTLLAAYPLSRRDLYGRGLITAYFVFPMLFSGGMIPTYLVVQQTHLLNTRWALIVPTALGIWNVIITRTYFQMTIPDELLEAARVDGCDDFRFFLRVVLPLSKPIIAVNALLYAVGQWNQFFNALIYLTDDQLFPLQLVLRQILVQNTVDPSQLSDPTALARQEHLRDLVKYSLIVVSSLPPLLAYPFVQKYFVKGLMIGSLKG